MSDDLISRKDLGAAIDSWLTIDRYYHPYSKQKTIPVSELIEIIKLLPTAGTEIVRCKDCKYFETDWESSSWGEGDHYCSYTDSVWSSDEYCSRAERRREEERG